MKKLLCLLMALLLICSGMLGAAAAEETSLQDRITSAAAGSVIVLQADTEEAITVGKNLTLDLNGYCVSGMITVESGYSLTLKDSATDDYTVEDEKGYGKLAAVSGTVKAEKGYMQVTEAGGISFHKYTMKVTKVTLRSEVVGIYYTGEFYGDEVVADQVEVFGIALRLKSAPDAAYLRTGSACSRFYAFKAGSAGNTATGTLLKNVMRKGRPQKENETNSETRIYGMPYLRTVDGEYYFGDGVSKSFMKVMQEAERQWDSLTKIQQDAIWALYNKFESIMDTWDLPNLHPGDVEIPI